MSISLLVHTAFCSLLFAGSALAIGLTAEEKAIKKLVEADREEIRREADRLRREEIPAEIQRVREELAEEAAKTSLTLKELRESGAEGIQEIRDSAKELREKGLVGDAETEAETETEAEAEGDTEAEEGGKEG